MRSALIISFVLIGFQAFSLTTQKLLEKMQKTYNRSDYSYVVTYTMYAGESSTNVLKNYTGKTLYHNRNLYQKQRNMEFVSTSQFSLKLMHNEKTISLSGANRSNKPFDIRSYLFGAEKTNLNELDTSYEVTINYADESAGEFSKITLKVDKETLLMTELTLYHKRFQEFLTMNGETESARPRVTMKFSNIELNPDIDQKIFELSNYVDDSNNSANGIEKLIEYKVYDTRTK